MKNLQTDLFIVLGTVVSVYMGVRCAGPCIYILIDYQANDNNLIIEMERTAPVVGSCVI